MSDHKDLDDQETVLMALDQISQTIEVMTRVVNRLRRHVKDQGQSAGGDSNGEAGPDVRKPGDQTLH
jgi:hypothetical protein